MQGTYGYDHRDNIRVEIHRVFVTESDDCKEYSFSAQIYLNENLVFEKEINERYSIPFWDMRDSLIEGLARDIALERWLTENSLERSRKTNMPIPPEPKVVVEDFSTRENK